MSEGEATVQLKEHRYFAVIMFVYGDGCDWLGALWRDPGGPWHTTYRFRYYRDGKACGSSDEKRCFEATANRDIPEEHAVATLRKLADALVAQGFGPKLDVLEPKSDDPMSIYALLLAQPWAHTEMPRGEA